LEPTDSPAGAREDFGQNRPKNNKIMLASRICEVSRFEIIRFFFLGPPVVFTNKLTPEIMTCQICEYFAALLTPLDNFLPHPRQLSMHLAAGINAINSSVDVRLKTLTIASRRP
jgi:hypothetical protein